MFNNQNSNFTDGWIESEFNSSPSAHNAGKPENFWLTHTEGCNILLQASAAFSDVWLEIRYFYVS